MILHISHQSNPLIVINHAVIISVAHKKHFFDFFVSDRFAGKAGKTGVNQL